MHHAILDNWSRGRSFLHRLDPRVKTIALLVFLIGLAITPPARHMVFAGFFAALLAGLYLARLPLVPMLWRAAFVLPFSATFAIVSVLAGDTARAAALVEKSFLSAFAVLLVIATTPLPRLMRGLEALRVPRALVLVAQFLYRYLFVISEQAQHMAQAARCRGGRPRFRAAAGALGVLFARSYRRAEGIQNAMAARGFSGHFPTLDERR